MEISSQQGQKPNATVIMKVNGETIKAAAEGNGPVDAVFKAIEQQAQSGAKLVLYSVNAISQGSESQGDAAVRLEHQGAVVNGVGADTDVIAASAKAYINALNSLLVADERSRPKYHGV